MTPSSHNKIVDAERLARIVADARRAGKTIVQCHGCFDIVHPGHVRYLQFAREQGDVLIVSLTGDSDIDKGTGRPYIPQELRAENLAALMAVDYVHIHPLPTAEGLLARIKPDIYVKGAEYEHATDPGFLAEKQVVESQGGRVIFSSGEVVFSSTELIGRVRDDAATGQHLGYVTRRHGIDVDSVQRTIGSFRGLNVLVIGDLVVDRYVFCDAIGIARESPMMSLIQRDQRTYLGGAGIVARHLTGLGARAFLLSAGARDEATAEARQTLLADGVEMSLIESRPALVEKTRYLAEDTKLFKVDHGQRLPLDSRAEREAATILERRVREADAVIICDFGYGMITRSLLSRVLPMLRHNVPVLTADVSGGQASLLEFRHVDLLCPTEREARTTLNDFSAGLSTLAWQLMDKTQARHLFMTLEKRGMVVFDRRSQDRTTSDWSARLKSDQLPALTQTPVDLLGCGDALLATATLSLAAGADLMTAAYLGNAAAAIEASTLGNEPIKLGALQRWLRGRPELVPEHSKPTGDVLPTPTAVSSPSERATT